MWNTIFIILGILALLLVLIKIFTREKEDTLSSRMHSLSDRFASACKKILNFGC
jgi:hypothetical protein